MKTIVMGIEGMSCNHCKMAVEKELKSFDGVIDVEVSLENKNAKIEYDEKKVQESALKEAVKNLGYRPL